MNTETKVCSRQGSPRLASAERDHSIEREDAVFGFVREPSAVSSGDALDDTVSFHVPTGEDYEGTGLMTSYNRIGAAWAGGSRALLTNLLRDEWGFDGVVITDFSDHAEYMNGNVMLRAGGDLWMQMMSGSISDASGSVDYLLALRTASKHVLYAYLNARVANIDYVEATGESAVLRPTITGFSSITSIIGSVFTVISIALLALAVWRLVVGIRLKRAQKEAAAE